MFSLPVVSSRGAIRSDPDRRDLVQLARKRLEATAKSGCDRYGLSASITAGNSDAQVKPADLPATVPDLGCHHPAAQ